MSIAPRRRPSLFSFLLLLLGWVTSPAAAHASMLSEAWDSLALAAEENMSMGEKQETPPKAPAAIPTQADPSPSEKPAAPQHFLTVPAPKAPVTPAVATSTAATPPASSEQKPENIVKPAKKIATAKAAKMASAPTPKTPEKPSKKLPEKLATKPIAPAASSAPAAPTPAPTASGDELLKHALEYVYSNHPHIQAQREALKATDEGVAQAVSGFRPDVSADLSKGRTRTGNTSQTWGYDDSKNRSLSVNQPVFNGGGSVAGFKAAKEQVKAARADLSATEQQVLYDAVVAYTDVVEKQLVLELNQKNVDVLKQQLDVTQARFNVGELTVTDVSQATARLAQAQADERQSLGDVETARVTFRRVIGYDVPEKLLMPSVPAGLPESIGQAKEWAQDANPILEAARHLEKAADHNVYVMGASILPSVALEGSMSRATGGVSSTLHNLDTDAIKLNLHIPLYQSGAEWSRLREARNQAQQASFNALDTQGSVVETVSTAWENYNTAKAIITSNEASLNASETALDGVRKENEFGVRTVLDVLNAEQEAFAARVNLVKAVRAEKVQAYRLLAAVGKLTSEQLQLKTDVPNPKEHYDSVKYQLLGL